MTQQQTVTDWLDFNEIRKQAEVEYVLAELGLLEGLSHHGDEFSGWCPLGTKKHGKKDSFSINSEKKTFQCFACQSRGTVLDFVARFKDVHIRDGARLLKAINDKNTGDTRPEQEASPGGDETAEETTVKGSLLLVDKSAIATEFLSLQEEIEALQKLFNGVLEGLKRRCGEAVQSLNLPPE